MKDAVLWKRILNEGINYRFNNDLSLDREAEKLMVEDIIKAPIIIDGLSPEHLSDEMNWGVYRNLSIPFPMFWVETTMTDGQVGALWRVTQTDSGFFVYAAIVCSHESVRPTCACLAKFPLDSGGSLILPPGDTWNIETTFHPAYQTPETYQLGRMLCFQSLSNVMDVLLLLSCKNVSLQSKDTDRAHRKRAAREHGGRPEDYRYHVLVVRPAGAKSDVPAQEVGLMPRHVARGHFAEYGPQYGKGLLFGKFSGRFYIPPHLRGNDKNGTVEKDYRIDPPKPPDAA